MVTVAPQRVLRTPAFTPDGTAGNRLKQLLTDPNSFKGTPGFQFALNTGLDTLDRKNSTIRNTPNALLEAMKYGTGLAQQDYGGEVSRLGQLSGQEQSYDLGLGSEANTAQRTANDLALGQESNANQRYATDTGAATSRYNTDASTGLGYFKTNADFILGQGANNNTAANNQMNYRINQGRNANDAASVFSNYDLGQGRNAVDWYNAGTNRGAQEGNAWNQGQHTAQEWYKTLPQSGRNPNTGALWYSRPGG